VNREGTRGVARLIAADAFGSGESGYPGYVTKTMTCLELSLPALPQCVREARLAVGEAVGSLASRKLRVDDVRLCVSEAVTNVVRHAYGRRRGRVDIVVERDADELTVVVRDSGIGMPPPSRRDESDGFGLKIIDELARENTISQPADGGTEIAMVFDLAPSVERVALPSP
jgi:anti-sigma regulatory factor (Ser/Thr protein kinase)